MNLIRQIAIGAMMLMLVWGGTAPADDFDMSRFTIDGGGAMFSTGGDFEVSGTIGQPEASALAGGGFVLTGGFWFAIPPDDCNTDGTVNLYDYVDCESCLSGPGDALPLSDCRCFDLDEDGDIDLFDVARFQTEFTGG
jgi:hypothetical protein